jgi:hypothetical protein
VLNENAAGLKIWMMREEKEIALALRGMVLELKECDYRGIDNGR